MATSNNPQTKQNNTQLGRAAKENYQILTGTVDRLIKWHRENPAFRYYEVIASLVSIQEGNSPKQKVMLLKDKKGPILQVLYYCGDRINITDFSAGQMLRCVGRMVGPNMLQASTIRDASPEDVVNFQRICYICDHAAKRE